MTEVKSFQVLFGEDFEILENRTMVSHQNVLMGMKVG
jgi:hypothetical protein